jgi:hypothetical protein
MMRAEVYHGLIGGAVSALVWYLMCAAIAWDSNPAHWVSIIGGHPDSTPRLFAIIFGAMWTAGGSAAAVPFFRWAYKDDADG